MKYKRVSNTDKPPYLKFEAMGGADKLIEIGLCTTKEIDVIIDSLEKDKDGKVIKITVKKLVIDTLNEGIFNEDNIPSKNEAGNYLYNLVDGVFVEKTVSEIAVIDKETSIANKYKEIEECKKQLETTDWAVTKCAELNLDFKEKYPAINTDRVKLRVTINTLETEINTLEE